MWRAKPTPPFGESVKLWADPEVESDVADHEKDGLKLGNSVCHGKSGKEKGAEQPGLLEDPGSP